MKIFSVILSFFLLGQAFGIDISDLVGSGAGTSEFFDINIIANDHNPLFRCEEEGATTVDSCFAQKPISNGPMDIMMKDLEVCACLKRINPEKSHHPASQDHRPELSRKSNYKVKALVLQSVFLAKDDKELDKLLGKYYPSETQAQAQKIHQSASSNTPSGFKNFLKQTLSKVGLQKKYDAALGNYLNASSIKPEDLRNVYENIKRPTPTCLSMQNYLTMTQLPLEKEFWEQLNKSSEFNQAEWDYEGLEKRERKIRELYSNSDEQDERQKLMKEFTTLKSKLKFLNRNPVFKYTFHATRGTLIGDTKKKQKDLFNILKSVLPKDEHCWEEDNVCASQVFNSERFNEFRDQTIKFADVKEVARLVRREASEDIQRSLKDLENEKYWSSEKISLDLNAIALKVQRTTNIDTDVRHCQGGHGIDIPWDDCIHSYQGAYCDILKTVESKLYGREELPSIEHEIINETELDPNKNQKFKKLSEFYCETKRKSMQGSGEALDFNEYHHQKCNGKETIQGCRKEEDKDVLFAQYIKENVYLSDPGDSSRPVAALNSLGLGASKTSKVSLDSPDVGKTVNQINSSNLSINDSVERAGEIFSGITGGLPDSTQSQDAGISSSMVDLPESISDADKKQNQQSSEMDYGTYMAAPAPANTAEAMGANAKNASEVQKLKARAESEKEEVEDELAETKRKLASAAEDAQKNELENRVKMLEQLLSQKDKTVGEYQRLFDKLSKDKEEQLSEKGRPEKSSVKDSERVAGTSALSDDNFEAPEATNNRAPASVSDKAFSSAGSMGSKSGAASLTGNNGANTSKAMAARSFNEALLSKYGITVQGPVDAQVLVAPDKDTQSLPQVLTSTERNVPLDVSRTQFEKFKSNDLETLQEIYEDKLKTLSGNIVKIQVTTQGEKEPLEFYAIKEGDKVIFQPVRKARLHDLQLTLPST